MDIQCPNSPENKREYLSKLANILIKDYGKKKYYKPKEVKDSNRKITYDSGEFSCWGMSFFCSHVDFDIYHQESGEECDYTEMRKVMLSDFSDTTNADWTEILNIKDKSSWENIGDTFGNLFEGAADAIGDVFDAID